MKSVDHYLPWILAAMAVLTACEGTDQTATLDVQRIVAVTGGMPRAVAVADNGDVAFWMHDGRLVISRASGQEIEAEARVRDVVGISWVGNRVELVDAQLRRIVRVYPGSPSVDAQRFRTGGAVEDAAFIDGRWIGLIRIAFNHLRIVDLRDSDQVLYELTRESDIRITARIGGGLGLVTLAELSNDYGSRVISLKTRLATPLEADSSRIASPRSALLVSLPILATKAGLLKTISDVRSDDRHILVFDPITARVRTSLHIKAPLGFAAASSSGRLVAAVRNIDRPEIVIYQIRGE